MRKFSRRKINKIHDLRNLGFSVRKIADELNCSPTTVQKYYTENRNYEMPLLNLFPEKNLLKKTYAPASSQSTQGSYQPQVHHYYHSPEDTSFFEQQRQYIDQENKQREQEKERLEQARKSDQRNWEQLLQRKMEFYSMKQEQKRHMRLKTLAARLKTLEDERERAKDRFKKDNEFNKEMSVMAQEGKEEDIEKVQENQQVNEMNPRVIDETMAEHGFNKQTGEEKPQKDEESSADQTSLQAKQVEVEESPGSDQSAIFQGIVFGGIQTICEISNLLNSPESNVPITSPEFWRQLSKRLQDDNKKRRNFFL